MSVATPSFGRPAPPAGRRPTGLASRRFQIIAAVALLVPTAIGSIGYVQASGYIRAVATTGSDASAGTEAAPWRTIGHALAALTAGDTLVVHGGTYVEHVAAVLHAGTASAPIIVRAASGERPIVKGLLWLTSPTWWTFDGLNVTWDATTDTASQHMVRLFGGSNWTFKNAEVWGAHSYAGILVGQTPSNWRITANCIHDTYASNSTNQDHNIYVNSGLSAGPGSIDHNILFNATNGRNIKLGGPSISDTNGTQNVSISYNTLYNANQNVSMSGSSRNNTVDHNILGKSLENHLIYGYSLFGTGNVAANNVGFLSTKLIDGTNISDGGGNVFPRDPGFDGLGCGGFHPADATSQAYGAYAGGTILPGPIATPKPTATAAPTGTPAPIALAATATPAPTGTAAPTSTPSAAAPTPTLNPTPTPTPTSTSPTSSNTLTFTPVADAHVGSSNVNGNYGSLTTMKVRDGDGSTTNPNYRGYLKFNLSGVSGTVSSVKLRLFVTDPSANLESVFLVTDNAWTETGITFANAPTLAGLPAIGGSTLPTVGTYVAMTLSPTTVTADTTTLSLALKSASTNSAIFSSREDAANKPELVVTFR
jgi:hypothetical protein